MICKPCNVCGNRPRETRETRKLKLFVYSTNLLLARCFYACLPLVYLSSISSVHFASAFSLNTSLPLLSFSLFVHLFLANFHDSGKLTANLVFVPAINKLNSCVYKQSYILTRQEGLYLFLNCLTYLTIWSVKFYFSFL